MLKLFILHSLRDKSFLFRYIGSLVLSVLGLYIVLTYKIQLQGTIKQQANTLLSSDLLVSSRFAIDEKKLNSVDQTLIDIKDERLYQVSMLSMVGFEENGEVRSQLAQLKWTDPGYPHYGGLMGEGETEYGKFLEQEQYIWIDQSFAELYSIQKNTKVQIGESEFIVRKILKDDTSRSFKFFNFYPTIYIPRKFLEQSRLLQKGTTAYYNYFYKFKNTETEIPSLKEKLNNSLQDSSIKISLPKDSGNQRTRVFQMLNEYLGLIGIIILFLGGMSALYTAKNFTWKKIYDYAIFRIHGLSQKKLFSYFLVNHFIFAIFSFLIASILLLGLIFLFKQTEFNLISFNLFETFKLELVVSIIAILFFTSLFFSLPTMLRMVGYPLKSLLSEFRELKGLKNAYFVFYYLPLVFFLWLLAIIISNSFFVGSLFFILTLVFLLFLVLVLNIGFKVLQKLVSNNDSRLHYLNRYSIKSFFRFKNNRLLFIILLTLSLSMMNLIFFLESSFMEQIGNAQNKPEHFLFDIQEEQVEPLQNKLNELNIDLLGLTPMVRGRLVSINNQKISELMNKKEIFETRENEREKGFLNRGINITYTDKLGPHERIIKGKPLPTTWNSFKNVPISLEKRYARRLDIELGDTLVFDILGLEISTVVQNFREVDWISFYPNFFIQFPLGVFDDAPKTFLAVLSELDIETRKKFIQVSSKEFPNIPVINLKHIIEKVIKIFDFISLSLKIMSLLCFIVASFIILNLIYEKILIELKDYSLLRLIGVKKKELIKMVSKEVLILLLGAIVLSILGTLGINFGVNYFVFNSYFLKIPIIVLWVNLFLCMMIFMGIYILLRYQLKKEIKQNLFY